MSMTLSGNGTITGLVSGGLPDGTILPADLSTGGPSWDTSGNLGLGVTPSAWSTFKAVEFGNVGVFVGGITARPHQIDVGTNTYYNAGYKYAATGYAAALYEQSNGYHTWWTAPSGTAGNAITFIDAMKLDSSGNLQFNSGYGSVATAYGCRAWVNFNGTGTVAIRASGNVSSITDNGMGDYTVNFTTAMPDANYAASGSVGGAGAGSADGGVSIHGASAGAAATTITASALRIYTGYYGSVVDYPQIHISIFR